MIRTLYAAKLFLHATNVNTLLNLEVMKASGHSGPSQDPFDEEILKSISAEMKRPNKRSVKWTLLAYFIRI